MTYEQFLAKLRETPRDWRLIHREVIRDQSTEHCPLTRVSGRAPMTIEQCATKLEISLTLAKAIADAADKSRDHNPEIRADLLAACGLTEREKGGGA